MDQNVLNLMSQRIAVVIPAYKVSAQIVDVIESIPESVWRIYVVDDACSEKTGALVESSISSDRIRIIYHDFNKGVGGAVMTGYQVAIEDGAKIIVKVDGDGQMNPELIPAFIGPILLGEADYTKGNRFFNLEEIRVMPKMRLFGNAALSFLTKISSGYWDLFDPTNGFTAIHADVAKMLPFNKISCRYFFETDMLFRLNILRAVVVDIPMSARYKDETSNLKISNVFIEFFLKHIRNFSKRIFYNYYLRDLSIASLELPVGLVLFLGGSFFGFFSWQETSNSGNIATAGTVMLSALPMLMGLQFVLAFLAFDIAAIPKYPLQNRLSRFKK